MALILINLELSKGFARSAALILIIIVPLKANASLPCKGRFVNPLTDICWSCIMPISVGEWKFGTATSKPKNRDTKNPSCPLCSCIKANVPIPGISVGFWEPVRLVDVTRTPYCMTNLGGIQIGSDLKKLGGFQQSYDKNHPKHSSFYHLHYYIYPLIYWLELITDFMCLEKSTFDVAYMSEFDPTWNDSKLHNLLNPEVFLFANPLAQAACTLDCTAATTHLPRDELFWCAGCYGNIYPFSGSNSDHIGGIQSSSLLTVRILAKMHRLGLAEETSTSENTRLPGGGKLCRKSKALKIKKSQYKLQLTNPIPSTGDIGCWPLGFTDTLYSSGKEYPYDGEDFGYLIWRKINCCLF
jgi:conjugal transfer pilus assembly protein TraU